VQIANADNPWYRPAEHPYASDFQKNLKTDMRILKDMLEGRPFDPTQHTVRKPIKGPFKLHVSESVIIRRPIETVFAHITDPVFFMQEPQKERVERVTHHILGLFPITIKHRYLGIQEFRQISEGPLGAGTTFVQVNTLHGVPSETFIEVTGYEPRRLIAFKLTSDPRPPERRDGTSDPTRRVTWLEIRGELEQIAEGTQLTGTIYANEGGYTIMAPLLARGMRQGLAGVLHDLKEGLEAKQD